jgi:hypothetical protein
MFLFLALSMSTRGFEPSVNLTTSLAICYTPVEKRRQARGLR